MQPLDGTDSNISHGLEVLRNIENSESAFQAAPDSRLNSNLGKARLTPIGAKI